MLRVCEYVGRIEDFDKKNTQVVFIGHGGKKKGKSYAANLKLGDRIPLLVDPERKSHALLGMINCSWKDLLTDSEGLKLSKEAKKKGFKVGLLGTGSYTQLGGVAIIKGHQEISFFQKCKKTWDYPDVEEILAKCGSDE